MCLFYGKGHEEGERLEPSGCSDSMCVAKVPWIKLWVSCETHGVCGRTSVWWRHACRWPAPALLLVLPDSTLRGPSELAGEGENTSTRTPGFPASQEESSPRDTAKRSLLACGRLPSCGCSVTQWGLVIQKMPEIPTEWAPVLGGSAGHLQN